MTQSFQPVYKVTACPINQPKIYVHLVSPFIPKYVFKRTYSLFLIQRIYLSIHVHRVSQFLKQNDLALINDEINNRVMKITFIER